MDPFDFSPFYRALPVTSLGNLAARKGCLDKENRDASETGRSRLPSSFHVPVRDPKDYFFSASLALTASAIFCCRDGSSRRASFTASRP